MPRLRSVFAGILAAVTCPCHVPILLALLAGTSLGGVLAAHAGLVAGALTLVFLGALAFLFLANRDAPRTPTEDAGADLAGGVSAGMRVAQGREMPPLPGDEAECCRPARRAGGAAGRSDRSG